MTDLFDDTDRRILLALDEDPRMTVMALSQRCRLARGPRGARHAGCPCRE